MSYQLQRFTSCFNADAAASGNQSIDSIEQIFINQSAIFEQHINRAAEDSARRAKEIKFDQDNIKGATSPKKSQAKPVSGEQWNHKTVVPKLAQAKVKIATGTLRERTANRNGHIKHESDPAAAIYSDAELSLQKSGFLEDRTVD